MRSTVHPVSRWNLFTASLILAARCVRFSLICSMVNFISSPSLATHTQLRPASVEQTLAVSSICRVPHLIVDSRGKSVFRGHPTSLQKLLCGHQVIQLG